MRLVPTRCIRSHRPFQGTGASLYIGVGTPGAIAYRNNRLWPIGGMFTALGGSKIGGANTLKTARVASVADPTHAIPYTLPGTLASQTVFAQVRTYKDDCECETNFRPVRIELDGSLADATGIHGTATLLSQEKRDGGIVRLRFVYNASLTGIQPTLFRALRTAGPTSPADATVSYLPKSGPIEIDTPALSDASAYTYTLRAENGATTQNLITGLSVQADATGPTAPTSGSAISW